MTTSNAVCQCGRDSNRTHCPKCGSYQVYAVRSLTSRNRVDPRTGQIADFCGFRCRHCPNTFDDLDWRVNCQAEPARARNAIPAVSRKQPLSGINLLAVNKLRKERGMPLLDENGNELQAEITK